jgi:hypothetical protein
MAAQQSKILACACVTAGVGQPAAPVVTLQVGAPSLSSPCRVLDHSSIFGFVHLVMGIPEDLGVFLDPLGGLARARPTAAAILANYGLCRPRICLKSSGALRISWHWRTMGGSNSSSLPQPSLDSSRASVM